MITPVCPATQPELTWNQLGEVERVMDGATGLKAVLIGVGSSPVTPNSLLVRAAHRTAYPIWNGIPVLFAPEALASPSAGTEVDVRDPRYAEAYSERSCYEQATSDEQASIDESRGFGPLGLAVKAPASCRAMFLEPYTTWLDAGFNGRPQHTAFKFIAALPGKRVLRLGGRGVAAVKFLLAGAREAWLATPMPGEALSFSA